MSNDSNPVPNAQKNSSITSNGRTSRNPGKNTHNLLKNTSVDYKSVFGVDKNRKTKCSVYNSTQIDRGFAASPGEQVRSPGPGGAFSLAVKSPPTLNTPGGAFHNIYSIRPNVPSSRSKTPSPEYVESDPRTPSLIPSSEEDNRRKGRSTAFKTPAISGGLELNCKTFPSRHDGRKKGKANLTSDDSKNIEGYSSSTSKLEPIQGNARNLENPDANAMPPLMPPLLNQAQPPKKMQTLSASGGMGAYRQAFTARSPINPSSSVSLGWSQGSGNRGGGLGGGASHRLDPLLANNSETKWETPSLPNLKRSAVSRGSVSNGERSLTQANSAGGQSNPGDLELSCSLLEQSWLPYSPSSTSSSGSDTEANEDDAIRRLESESTKDAGNAGTDDEITTVVTIASTTTPTGTPVGGSKSTESRPLCQGFGFVGADKNRPRASPVVKMSPCVQFVRDGVPTPMERSGMSFTTSTVGVDADDSESSCVVAVGRSAARGSVGRKRSDFVSPRALEHFKALDAINTEKPSSGGDPYMTSDGGGAAAAIRRSTGVLSARETFFSSLPRLSDVIPTEITTKALEKVLLPGAPCTWLTCIALAISYVSGVPTTVEKVLRVNSIGMHCVCQPAVTLAEEYDLVSSYLHARFHRSTTTALYTAPEEFQEDDEASKWLKPEEQKLLPHLHCEMATFDSEVLDPIDENDTSYGMGEHAPVISLANFRKTLVKYLSDGRSIYIFNFDPYIIEMDEKRLRSNMAETEEEAESILANMRTKPNSEGAFGILLNFSVARNTATLVIPHLTREQHPMRKSNAEESDRSPPARAMGTCKSSSGDTVPHYCHLLSAEELQKRFSSVFSYVVLEEHVISLNVLYEAVRQRDSYTQLSRGFVRVFFDQNFSPRVPSIFPLFVLDGSSSAGLVTSVLDASIAPHLLGLAMMHHLTITFLLSDTARRKQSSRCLLNKANVCDVKLRGIPLTKIFQQLRLPLSIIVSSSTRSSIATVFAWYRIFLQNLQISQEVRLGIVLTERRGNSEDGQPNITEEQFLSHLRLVVQTRSVMLISFNINIAVNVKLSDGSQAAHFAIVIGLDEARGVIRLADVNVKRFRKTWHVPFHRLYNAVMGYGYVVSAKESKVIKGLNCKHFQAEVLKCGRHALPPQLEVSERRFEYPLRPYAVTLLADAVWRLGFHADVERFLNYSGFHISYFLSKRMPLEAAVQVVQNYSHYALDDALSVEATHFDYHKGNLPPGEEDPYHPVNPKHKVWTEEDLMRQIQDALASPSTRRLIVNFNRFMLHSNPELWNGSRDGGFYAMVMGYDDRQRLVALSDSNPCSFYRHFVLPLDYLFELLCSQDLGEQRAYGMLLLSREHPQEGLYDNTKGYDMAHAFVHHPFRPIFSAACSCMALAATEMMMSISMPTMLNGAPLALDDEKKKYRRYNNIFSAEDFLYALPSFNLHSWLMNTSSVLSSDVVTLANIAFQKLNLPLKVIDAMHGKAEVLTDPEAFIEACSGISGLFTITIIAYDTDMMYGVPHGSLGLVNRVELNEEDLGATTVQMLEGNPCLWGPICERTVRELMPMVSAIVCVCENMEEDGECGSSF
ncbi:unnamed protein product [Phytomonas sp. EM1]|nr:unnamed protein product [Phytomonas sp. EM1]|eukprot:CCW64933.1 unnamed protein product [Phytomonas sp. isolate EM1]